ncbi:MAG: hypothetical protein R3B68_08735 [Phycisphaerales bacterium]
MKFEAQAQTLSTVRMLLGSPVLERQKHVRWVLPSGVAVVAQKDNKSGRLGNVWVPDSARSRSLSCATVYPPGKGRHSALGRQVPGLTVGQQAVVCKVRTLSHLRELSMLLQGLR